MEASNLLHKLKQHVRADDFTEDDEILKHYLEAAIESTVNATNRTLEELLGLGGGQFPVSLQQAILLLAGHWYAQRETVNFGKMHSVPYAFDALVRPYRRLGKKNDLL